MKIIVNNLAIEYTDEGTGPVIVMLHGWQDSLHTFDALAEPLGSKFRVIRPDLPGFGGSEIPRTAWDVGMYTQFVAALVAKLKVEPYAYIGHSLGGRIMLKGLGGGGLQAEKAVFIASAGLAKTATVRNRLFAAAAKTGKTATAVWPLTKLRPALQARLYQRAGSDLLGAGPLKQTFLNIVREDLSQAARQVDVPALLIWGELDDQTPLADGQRLAHSLMPQATLKVINGAGHFVHHSHALQVEAQIKEFL